MAELSSEMGLSHTMTADSLDFVNIRMTYDANNADGKAIVANFKSNSNSNSIGYAFALYTDGTNYIRPTMIKTSKNQYLKYFDLTEDTVLTISNYTSTLFTITGSSGHYIVNGGPRKSGGCGNATAHCISDLYENHGWLSVWAVVQTAFIPATAVAVAATCAVHGCLL